MATSARILQLHQSIPVPVAMPYPLSIDELTVTHRNRYLVFKTSGDGLAVVSLSRGCLGLFQQTQVPSSVQKSSAESCDVAHGMGSPDPCASTKEAFIAI